MRPVHCQYRPRAQFTYPTLPSLLIEQGGKYMGEVLPATLERSPKNKLCSVLHPQNRQKPPTCWIE